MSEKDITALVRKYELAMQSGKVIYLDANEFEDLADYYDSIDEVGIASEVVEAGLLIHPGNNSLYLKKAKLLAYDSEYLDALKLLDQISMDYDFDFYLVRIECHLQLGNYKEAFDLTKEMLDKEEEEEMSHVFAELGFIYTEADFFKEAILYFNESLKHNPENLEVLSDLTYAYEMLGNFDESINTCNKILDIEPYSYETWVNIGKLYSLKDEFEKAIDAFDFALTINDSDSSILKLKAHCLSLGGRVEEAIEIFEELEQANTEDATLLFLLAECYQSLEQYEEALAYLEKYKEAIGETSEYFGKKSSLYMQKGDYDTAWSVVTAGLSEFNSALDLNMLAGEIAFKTEKYEEAEEYYLKVYADNLENFHLIDRMAILNIKLERYLEAIKYTEELLTLDSSSQAAKERLALLYFETDDNEKFNALLNSFSNEELLSLFSLIYTPQSPESFDRKMLIFYLNKAREARILFKNMDY